MYGASMKLKYNFFKDRDWSSYPADTGMHRHNPYDGFYDAVHGVGIRRDTD